MHGDYRIPTILKLVDTKTRELKSKDKEEDNHSIKVNTSDLDKWAEENLSKLSFSDEAFEKWVAETEKNGFRYR
jgi:hypothetical protein